MIQNYLPGWTKRPIPFSNFEQDFEQGIGLSQALRIDHHLIIFVHEDSSNINKSIPQPNKKRTALLAVDLRDYSVQEAEIGNRFDFHVDYSICKYKDNQIIKFGGRLNDKTSFQKIDWIKIESFNRIYLRIPISKHTLTAFKVNLKEIIPLKGRTFYARETTCQIYQDCLYLCAEDLPTGIIQLWNFDLGTING